jgi:hypothetical protein
MTHKAQLYSRLRLLEEESQPIQGMNSEDLFDWDETEEYDPDCDD